MKYAHLRGIECDENSFTPEELALFLAARKHFAESPRWDDFKNRWYGAVMRYYDDQNLPRGESITKALYRVVQDMGSRLMIAAGVARMPDYQTQIANIIEEKFDTRRQFCEATGLSEDMLSHVLHGRKDLSIGTLTEALGKIGYGLSIVPVPQAAAR